MNVLFDYFQKLKSKRFFPFLSYIWFGLFCSLAFIPYKWTHFVWIAPWALFWLEKKYKSSYKKLFIHGTWAGAFVSLISYYWIVHLFTVFGGFPLFISILLFIGYAFVTNIRFGLFLVLFSFLKKKIGRYSSFTAAFVMLIVELTTWQNFPWYFGNLLAGNVILSQNIEYIGVYGLTILVILLSHSLYKIFSNINLLISHKKYFKKYLINLSIPSIALLIYFIFGYSLLTKWESTLPKSYVNVMMIQPDAPLEFRDGRSIAQTINDVIHNIEKLALEEGDKKKPDLIVLPESAVPFFSANNIRATNLYNRTYYEKFDALIYLLANRYKANVYFNELDSGFLDGLESKKNQIFYNNSTIYDPNGQRKESYRKSFLLAFGEYIPYGDKYPILYDIIPQVAKFFPGKENNLLDYYKLKNQNIPFNKSHLKLNDYSIMNLKSMKEYYSTNYQEIEVQGKFLPLICYEVILPEFVSKFSNSGNPDFIVNIVNDKWYGKSIESFQHLELARIRSIEYRKWMVRSTNSGTSVFVDHLGRVLNEKYTPIESQAVYSAQVDVIPSEKTFYLIYGDIFSYLFLLSFGLFLVNQLRLRKNK
jgi:apolipoprotein N-acyltransferase